MIIKTRREKFGGIVFFEKPGFVGYVNSAMADAIGIKKNRNAHYIDAVFASPLDAHFAVTTRCNMYCKGCYNTIKSDANVDIDLNKEFYFIGKTDEEYSLVCITEDTPINTIEREDGWKGFRIQGVLNFSLIGILSEISGILADNNIGIFSVSTFNTDYILVKEENFDRALKVLAFAGYNIV